MNSAGTPLARIALVALGSNIPSDFGTPVQTVRQAIKVLGDRLECAVTPSRLYVSPAFPAGSGPDFCNAVIAFETLEQPTDLLALLHKIELEFQRQRLTRWGPRTLDLDLIAVGQDILPDAATGAKWRALDPIKQRQAVPTTLILPHPRLQDRAFVLKPLSDISPQWRHPALGKTVARMLDDLSDEEKAATRPLK